MTSQHAPSIRFQAHLAFPQGLPLDQKCQKCLQSHSNARTEGQCSKKYSQNNGGHEMPACNTVYKKFGRYY